MAEAERLAGLESPSLPKLFEVCAAYTEVPDVARGVKALYKVLGSKKARQAKDYGTHITAFYRLISQLFNCSEIQLQAFALRLGMDCLKLVQRNAESGYPYEFKGFITDLMTTKHWSDKLVTCLVEEFCAEYLDVRFYLLRELKNLASYDAEVSSGKKRKRISMDVDQEELSRRIFTVLKQLPEPLRQANVQGTVRDDSPCLVENEICRQVKEYRSNFSAAWLQFLQMPMTFAVVNDVLQHIPAHVFPYVSNPLVLSNFYISAFSRGSLSVSVLSLSGLFYLITKHQLGDPEAVSKTSGEFYSKLYDLMTPEVFSIKHRTRFLRLLHLSLRSSLLPASFIAAFVKRCARVAVLVESPPATLWLLVHMYSLMQRHKAVCYPLLHKEPNEAKQFETDPWEWSASLQQAADMVLDTSLWEVELLKGHYHPSINRIAVLFDTDFFSKKAKKMDHEDFLDMSFDNLLEQEMQLKSKKWATQAPAVAFEVKGDEEADPVADLAFTAPF